MYVNVLIYSQTAGEAMVEKVTTELQAIKESNASLQHELTSLQVYVLCFMHYGNSLKAS